MQLIRDCVKFGRVTKILIESHFSDDLFDDYLVFSELVIMGQMIIDLVNFENIKNEG